MSGKISLIKSKFIWEAPFNPDNLLEACSEMLTFSNLTNPEIMTKWRLLFYPSGYRSDKSYTGDWVSFYFWSFNDNPIEASFTLSLLNQNNEKVFEKTVKSMVFEKIKWNNNGFPEYVEKSFILDPKNNIIKDNKVTFLCEMNTEETINQAPEESFSRLVEFDDFGKLFSNEEFSDVIFAIDGKSFNAHKCILASRSPVFNAMFKHDMIEKNENAVKIEDIEFEIFYEFMRFVYTGKVNEIEEIVCELLFAAEKYSVEGLKRLCEEKMCTGVDEDNAINYLCAADMNNATSTKIRIIKWISSCVKNFFKKSEFKSLVKTHPELFYEIMEENHKD